MVACVCPTIAARREWLPAAIACYRAQTWPGRQLIIVADEDCDLPGELPSETRVIGVRRGLAIGAKRNIGCAETDAEFIAHFDDDDYSAPMRLATQIALLIACDKAVTGYHSMKFTDGRRWWKNRNIRSWAFDSSLVYRRDFWERHKFSPVNDGLEMAFRDAAWREGELVSVDAGDMMHASIHPGNTSPRAIGEGWEDL